MEIHRRLSVQPCSFVVGWLDDLKRFQYIVSLNLADNDLGAFPGIVCQLPRLVDLNLASNNIETIPSEIDKLSK